MILSSEEQTKKRKIILALMTICILSFASCGKQETTATAEPIPTAVESAQVELTETTTETSLVDYSQREGSLKESHPNIIIFTNEKNSGTPYP